MVQVIATMGHLPAPAGLRDATPLDIMKKYPEFQSEGNGTSHCWPNFDPGIQKSGDRVQFKMAAGRAYSVYPFPELTGPHGVGCSDCLIHTGKSDQALLIRMYYPSAQRPESVPKANLAQWLPHRKYLKAMLTSVMGMSSVLATPLAPVLSLATGRPVAVPSQLLQHDSMANSS